VALAYVGSGEHLEIAVNGGRAADLLRLTHGSPIRIERRGR
jgi:S-adenosylmethionine hydrolase